MMMMMMMHQVTGFTFNHSYSGCSIPGWNLWIVHCGKIHRGLRRWNLLSAISNIGISSSSRTRWSTGLLLWLVGSSSTTTSALCIVPVELVHGENFVSWSQNAWRQTKETRQEDTSRVSPPHQDVFLTWRRCHSSVLFLVICYLWVILLGHHLFCDFNWSINLHIEAWTIQLFSLLIYRWCILMDKISHLFSSSWLMNYLAAGSCGQMVPRWLVSIQLSH